MAEGPLALRRRLGPREAELAPRDPIGERREAIRRRLPEAGARGFLATSRANIRYLSGFTGSTAVLVVREELPDLLLTTALYATQAPAEIAADVEVRVGTHPPLAAAREALAGDGDAIAFEAAHLSVAEWRAWDKAEGPPLEPVEGWVEQLRAVKSEAERAALARAAAAADRAFEAILPEVRPGVTERGLAARIDWLLVEHGSDGVAFETIVLSGEHAALPHGRPGRRAVARGDGVLFDFGAVVDGYASDISRTVVCGAPDPRLREAYELVLAAQRAAIEGIVPGMTGREADALARRPIEEAGHGKRFGHGLGHGIGLEVHEEPRLARTSDGTLRAGTVVTVEPGIYIEGLGGVRIEDVVVVRPEGAEMLTRAPKDDLIAL